METTKKKHHPLVWMKKHKALTAVILVAVLAAVLILRGVLNSRKAAETGYQFVRTTTLQKSSLTDSVNVNGTVKSGDEASVTVADSAKLYKVAEVKVAVGDTVKKGDVIATLDTSDLQRQIESAEQSYNDTLQSAKTSHDRAVDDFTVSAVKHENTLIDLQAAIETADDNLTQAKDNLTKAQENERAAQGTYDSAVSDYNAVKDGYDKATSNISTFTKALNDAADVQNQKLAALNAANASGDTEAINNAQDELTTAQNNYSAASAALATAQNDCSVPSLGLYGYQSISAALTQKETAKTQADTALESAKSAVQNAQNAVTSAEQQVKNAHDNYDNEKNYSALTTKNQTVEDSKTKLQQAARTPDNLKTLYDTLENCTLTATMDGTVTALNATVGSVCNGAVATIQNTDALTVEITIPANSVPAVSIGMPCRITSDATGDAVINGTLTQIDPVANEKGSFGGKVTVTGDAGDLLIGISAKVEIVKNEKENVFSVPRDAVGTKEDGTTYVLRKTGGEGVDMTFEEVTVTVGDGNDFYVEISGDELNEGDVIRATADLTQGIETATDAESQLVAMMQGGRGVVMTDGSVDPADAANARVEGGGPGGPQ